ncbi:MAG TPA: hypothetical protein DCZ63_09105 [Geobacter sp.]|nr:hypothetical protein [Geobacter sp.]
MRYALIFLLLAGCARSGYGEKVCAFDVELRMSGTHDQSTSRMIQSGVNGSAEHGVIWSTGLQYDDGIRADSPRVIGHELMHLAHDACPDIFADPDK